MNMSECQTETNDRKCSSLRKEGKKWKGNHKYCENIEKTVGLQVQMV